MPQWCTSCASDGGRAVDEGDEPMLNSKNLNKKTFEERYSEALTQIPLYTDEWTNFNDRKHFFHCNKPYFHAYPLLHKSEQD